MSWLSLGTAILKLVGVILGWLERRSLMKAGAQEQANKTREKLLKRIEDAQKARHNLTDDGRRRLRDKYRGDDGE